MQRGIKFYPGIGYGNLMVIKGVNKHLDCTPPYDLPGTPFIDVMVKAKNKEAL